MSSRETSNLSFHFGPWRVDPAKRSLQQGAEIRYLEPLAMEVLVALCQRAGEVVSTETLLLACWGTTLHGDNPVHKIVTQLRKALGDDTAAPIYIATIRKRGYQTLAAVTFADGRADVLPGSWREGSPFRGLESFDERHAAVFHGRREAITQLKQSLLCQIAAGYALQLLLGPSGSGKTSLVRAGLIPALLLPTQDEAARIVGVAQWNLGDVGEHSLFASLASSLIDWDIGGKPVFADVSAAELGARIAAEPGCLDAALAAALEAANGNEGVGVGKGRLLLFLDRFEALFTLPQLDAAERQRLLDLLERMARCPWIVVVVACRNDFYPQIAAIPALMAAKANGGHFDLQPPSAAELAQMIRLPALAAGLRFGVDAGSGAKLDDVLCDSAARSPDALPLLQYTLQELHRQCLASSQDGGDLGELSFAAYHSLGGLEGALAHRAEALVNGLDEAPRAALTRVLSLVVTISIHDETVTSRSAAWADLHSDAERELVGALVESRLFVSHLRDGASGFGVAHEALLRRWPRITEWVAAHRQVLRTRARVAAQAARWVEDGRNADLLLPRGKPMEEAASLLVVDAFSLSEDEKALINDSARKVRWLNRLRTSVVIMIGALAVLATGLGISAVSARRVAEQKRTEAEGLMGFMLNDFADKVRPLARLDLLDAISSKALGYLAADSEASLSPAAQTQRAKALQVISEVRIARGDAKSAEEALQVAHKILSRQASETPADTGVLKNRGVNAYWLGRIHRDRNELDAAERYYREYLETSNELNRLEPDNAEWWVEQSYGHNNLGGLAERRGDLVQAREAFKRSLALKARALEKRPDDRTLAGDLADTHSWVGRVECIGGNLAKALESYRRAMHLLEGIRQSAPTETIWTFRLLVNFHRQAEILDASGADTEAAAAIDRAVDLAQAIVKTDSTNSLWQSALVSTQNLAFTIRLHQGGAIDTSERFAKTVKAFDELIGIKNKNINFATVAAKAHRLMAISLWQANRHGEAMKHLEEARRIMEATQQATPNQESRAAYAEVLLTYSELDKSAGRSNLAVEACGKARDILAVDAVNSAYYRILDPWVRAHICLKQEGRIADELSRLAKMGYRSTGYSRFISNHQ